MTVQEAEVMAAAWFAALALTGTGLVWFWRKYQNWRMQRLFLAIPLIGLMLYEAAACFGNALYAYDPPFIG